MTSKRTLFCSALLALALAGGATACGGSDDSKKADSDSSTSASTSPSAGGSAGSNKGADGKSSNEVEFKASEGLPKDYPADDVPLTAGKVLSSTTGAFLPSGKQVKGWTVRVKSSTSAAKAVDAATAKLTDAGFKPVKTKDAMTNQAVLEDDTYDVRVLGSKVKGGSIVIYTVTFA